MCEFLLSQSHEILQYFQAKIPWILQNFGGINGIPQKIPHSAASLKRPFHKHSSFHQTSVYEFLALVYLRADEEKLFS